MTTEELKRKIETTRDSALNWGLLAAIIGMVVDVILVLLLLKNS
jgi:hypothetical protein